MVFRILHRFWMRLARIEFLWGMVQFVVPSAGAYMTYLLGVWEYMPTAWALFTATGVFAFTFISLREMIRLLGAWRLDGKLVPIEVTAWGIRRDRKLQIKLTLELQNIDEKTLFLQEKDRSASIDRSTYGTGAIIHVDAQLPPGKRVKVFFPEIEVNDLDFDSKGHLMMRIAYGRNPDALEQVMKCEYEIDFQPIHGRDDFVFEKAPQRMKVLEYTLA